VNEDRDCPLKTKRLVIGQITVCRGCCCGNVERGLPEVPVEWLKNEWRKRGLLKRVQLTISGCVGPCDVPNVVLITTSAGTEWRGISLRSTSTEPCLNGLCAAETPARCWPCPANSMSAGSARFVRKRFRNPLAL
jgi:cobaltochelatase CobN